MMRVGSQVVSAPLTVHGAALALTALLVAACASKAIEDAEPGGDTPRAGSSSEPEPTGGTSSVPLPSGGDAAAPVPNGAAPDYQKQDYPAGPYGTGVGATLENFAFLGWRDPVASGYDVNKLEQVRLGEFYNPDGRSNIRVIWINASAVWCTVCRSELKEINDRGVYEAFAPRGLAMIETLFEDNSSRPATPLDLKRWGELPAHSIEFPLLLDPGFKLGTFFTSDATPLNMLVDASTMRVIDATMGYSSDYWDRVVPLLQ
jgi:hypothetical protein